MSDKLTAIVINTIQASSWHLESLRAVRTLGLPDWAIGAGFVRNAVWDHLHGYHAHTPLSDIDVLYFDPANTSREIEVEIEKTLLVALPMRPWSVRNQARMHLRNCDPPYSSTADAISYFLETPTCVAVWLDDNDDIIVISPFGLSDLIDMRGTPTASGRQRMEQYLKRMTAKNWPQNWPRVKVEGLQ